jgi:hypothetical protein
LFGFVLRSISSGIDASESDSNIADIFRGIEMGYRIELMTEMRFLETRNLKVVGVETTLSAGLKPVKALDMYGQQLGGPYTAVTE